MNRPTEQDILYIHPPKLPGWVPRKWREAFASFQVMPMGAVALVNLLRESGFPVTGLNYAMELDLDPLFDLTAWLETRSSPLLVVLDLHWLEHSFGTMEVARACKEAYPGVPVAIGGLTASLYAQEILREFPQVDFVIRGDAEAGLVGLARHLAEGRPDFQAIPNLSLRIAGKVVENPLTYIAGSDELDSLDFVSSDFLVHQEEYYWRQSSRYRKICGHWLCVGRGCRHDCCWCGGARSVHERIAGRRKLVVRSPARLVDDLERLYQLGLDQAALSHDLAQPGRSYWEQVLSGLGQKRINLGLWHQQFQLPSLDFLDALVKSVRIETSLLELTPLSGNEAVRRLNGKFFSNKQFLRTLRECRVREIPIFVYFSLNLPGENFHTYRETLALARQVHEIYPSYLLRMSNLFHTIDPGSAIARNPERFGLRSHWNGFLDYYRYCQCSTEAKDDEAAARLRGFETIEQRPLVDMFEQWVALCRQLGDDNCLHFP
jgi:radical SAM superfamily enzyme YgiQ (UPF0313 family)